MSGFVGRSLSRSRSDNRPPKPGSGTAEMTGAWTKIKTFYGFCKPYDFNVAIPALLNAALFVLVVIKFIGALINNNKARIYGPVERNFLTFPSEMFYFYIYIFIGIVLLTFLYETRRSIGRC